MKVRILKGYRDTFLRRTVRAEEELDVPVARAERLIEKGVAELIEEEIKKPKKSEKEK
jgi:hypothetical protein